MKIDMPCLSTRLVGRDQIVANNYNPNAVSPDKMQLLKQSILDNGFCFPIVTIWDPDRERYVIIDGFHRFTICQPEWLDIEEVPVVVLAHDIKQRLIATVQFNKARGVHQVDLDADLIRTLLEQGMEEEEIAVHLGIDVDTVYRYKQVSGIAALFAKAQHSLSWTMVEIEDRT